LKRAVVFMSRSFKVDRIQMSLWGSSLVNMYAKMWEHGGCLGEYSRRCHLKVWSLRMPYLEDVPCISMLKKLLNILNRCVKKMYSQMISTLFVFCQLVAM